jgi:hypothetical protein
MTPADYMAIASFGERYRLLTRFTNDLTVLHRILDALRPSDDKTQLYGALQEAMKLRPGPQSGVPSRRAIVVLSDGEDDASGITANDVVRDLQPFDTPIYAIGFSQDGRETPHLAALKRFAETSGGIYRTATGENIGAVYEDMRRSILNIFVAKMRCSRCRADGLEHDLKLTVVGSGEGDVAMSQTATVRHVTTRRGMPRWLLILLVGLGTLVVVGAVVLLVILVRRRRRPTTVPVTPPPPPPRPPARVAVRLALMLPGGGSESQTVRMAETAHIGSGAGCELRLPPLAAISPKHAKLVVSGDRVLIHDLTGNSQTIVDGVPVAGGYRLEEGDLIEIGGVGLRVMGIDDLRGA